MLTSSCRWLLLLLPLLCAWGCESPPRAPALGDEPIYLNEQEGLRFVAPEGWTQTARANLPSGKLAKERLLVSYRRSGEKPATLEVTALDLAAGQTVRQYLLDTPYSGFNWKAKEIEKPLEVQGVAALRTIFHAGAGKDEMTREIVTFQRGERTFFFAGIYGKADTRSREDVRRVVNTVLWR